MTSFLKLRIVLAFWMIAATPTVWAEITVETLSIENQANAGETYSNSFVIRNNDSTACEVSVYQTDYLFSCDGSNEFGEAGKLSRSNANWITFSPHRVIIPPFQTTTIHCNVRVPDDTAMSGTYWSILMVEKTAGTSLDDVLQLKDDQTGIRQRVRYGVQCVTNIGTAATEQLNVLGVQAFVNPGNNKELQLDIANTGERWAVPATWTELYDEQGKRVGRYEAESKRIFPGTSVRYRFSLGEIARGKYKALVVLDNGNQNVVGAKYDLEF
ncbi:MAG: hypothetical protein ACOZB3_03765 [Calditrichota bacterium]